MSRSFLLRLFGGAFIVLALSVFVFVQFRGSDRTNSPLVFAERTMLSALWDSYKNEYWEASSGRTLDKQSNNITTSEGQSYTMLRAVWESDKATFDKTWEFTKEQLQHDDDQLFAWKWGQRPDGTYGILEDQGGQNTASDGDSDIALSLVLAASRWQQASYLEEAKKIIPQIWEQEVITVNGTHYLAANDIEKFSQADAVINPSYLSPYAYRIFAKVDKKNDWNALVEDSYDVIDRTIAAPLDKTVSAGLPPDWFYLDKKTGEIKPPSGNLTTNYGFDAFRTPWRLALDYQWNNEPRAKASLDRMSFIGDQWSDKNMLNAVYAHDGAVVADYEKLSFYGGNIGYFVVSKPEQAKAVYEQKLKSVYDPTNERWNQEVGYYDDNWAWFGIALYNEYLDNPAKDL